MNNRYRWGAVGDVNAFFGLALDNIAGLILLVSLMTLKFEFPTDFALKYMIPGTAIGVLVGDLMYFFLALRLAQSNSRQTVTAMPLGLDTPSTFGIVFFVLGPCFLKAKGEMGMSPEEAAFYTWQIGICCLFISGVFKIACSFGAETVRNLFPRAGLLGSLAAIALVLISYLPLLDVLQVPIVGMLAMAIILTALVAQVPLPFKIPGAVGALLVSGVVYYAMSALDVLPKSGNPELEITAGLMPTEWLSALRCQWFSRMGDAVAYLPMAIPFALGTVVGGIDCTESAAAAGDHYKTRSIIAIEALATLAAAFTGGVIQTTPYIGHPAYKAMGARSAYTLATALFVGLAGILGVFSYFYVLIPKAAVYPILIFVGLEITAQSFIATPRRHYPAVAFACLPALAFLSMTFVGQIFGDPTMFGQNINIDSLATEDLRHNLNTAQLLSNSFILTSLFWASALAAAIDRRLFVSGGFYALAAVCTFFGIIHSPMPNNSIFLPFDIAGIDSAWLLPAELRPLMWNFALAYTVAAGCMFAWGIYLKKVGIYGQHYDPHNETGAAS